MVIEVVQREVVSMQKIINAGLVGFLIFFIFTCAAQAQELQPSEKNWVQAAAEKALPSVVNIASSKKVKVNPFPFSSDPFFRDFFGRGVPQERIQRALGSGVIVSENGIIVTNNHVVGGADEVEVFTSDGRNFPAKIIGTDPQSDVAVIKIDAKGLPAIKTADSSKLHIGDFVLAVGNPFGLQQTVTHGIISALGRSGLGITDYENFIQTDAPINPGNSGGALVNTKGELIGLNTAILSQSGGSVGIGFAIPVNLVMGVVRSIEKTGKVVRGWMGVSAQEITPQIAKAMGLETTRGALVVEVENGSPAQKAGIKQGDVLVSINGNEVRDASSIQLYISDVLPGTKVPVRLIRNGKTLTVNVTMGDLSKAQNAGEKYTVKDNRFLEGATVSDLTSGIRETLKIADNIKGVVTVSVQENTPAASMGIRPSDVIVQINGMKIGNLSEFKQALKKMQGRKATIGIYRQGMLMTMTLVR